jgi:amino acid transporter
MTDNQQMSPPGTVNAEGVQKSSTELKKELRPVDLVLAQILFITGSTWVGTAGKLGPSHLIFWLLAALLFYLPSAAVVIYLNRLMPLEGGLYQWAKLGFNDLLGFLVGWNLWLCIVVIMSHIGVETASYLSYALGSRASWFVGTKWFMVASNCIIMSALVVLAALGLAVGKWIHNVCSALGIIIFLLLIASPLLGFLKGTLSQYQPFEPTLPQLSLFNLNILGKMSFGAFVGFEYVAIFAGESRYPRRSMFRSLFFSIPLITCFYVLGTSAVLAFSTPENIDLIAPIPQALTKGFNGSRIVSYISPIVIFALLSFSIAGNNLAFNGNARLPMVAGWDRFLPTWFTRLHPKFKTPINSILFGGALTLLIGLVGLTGVGQQEAYQLLENSAGLFYALAYVVMFSIPLVGLKRIAHPPLWLRGVSLTGLCMTLLFIGFSVFPIVSVRSRIAFASKIIILIIAANLVGACLFIFRKNSPKKQLLQPKS